MADWYFDRDFPSQFSPSALYGEIPDHPHVSHRQIDEASIQELSLWSTNRELNGRLGRFGQLYAIKRERLEDSPREGATFEVPSFLLSGTVWNACNGTFHNWIQMNIYEQTPKLGNKNIVEKSNIHSPTVLIDVLAGSPCSDLACWNIFRGM